MPGTDTTSNPHDFAETARPAIVRAETIDPGAMSPGVLQAFGDELYAAHARIFDGVNRRQFDAYVVRSEAERTRIQVYRVSGRIVGYAAIHFFRRRIDGRLIWIVRVETGVEKAYRGRTVMGKFFIAETLMHVLRHPRAPMYGLSCMVHPAAYRRLLLHVPFAFPTPLRETPPEVHALMQMLAEEFGLARIEGASCFVRLVGWISRETRGDAASWVERGMNDPWSRFYLEMNPHYGQGQGLLTLAPISIRILVQAGLLLVRRGLERWFSLGVFIGRFRRRV